MPGTVRSRKVIVHKERKKRNRNENSRGIVWNKLEIDESGQPDGYKGIEPSAGKVRFCGTVS